MGCVVPGAGGIHVTVLILTTGLQCDDISTNSSSTCTHQQQLFTCTDHSGPAADQHCATALQLSRALPVLLIHTVEPAKSLELR
jgi:hypothetical protein